MGPIIDQELEKIDRFLNSIYCYENYTLIYIAIARN
jgi:hypothetical protein